MITKTFVFEKNGYKVFKLTVHGCIYFVIEGNSKRFIRKSMKTVEQIVS